MDDPIKRGEEIDKIIADVTERCATLFPQNWETVAKEILDKRNLDATTDSEIHDLMRQLVQLEAADPWIWLINQK